MIMIMIIMIMIMIMMIMIMMIMIYVDQVFPLSLVFFCLYLPVINNRF